MTDIVPGEPYSPWDDEQDGEWFGVRCIFVSRYRGRLAYEERVTVWRATDFDDAIRQAEQEAADYISDSQTGYTGLAQCFAMSGRLRPGAEVFSQIRLSDLPPEEYLDRFFDTGDEL